MKSGNKRFAQKVIAVVVIVIINAVIVVVDLGTTNVELCRSQCKVSSYSSSAPSMIHLD